MGLYTLKLIYFGLLPVVVLGVALIVKVKDRTAREDDSFWAYALGVIIGVFWPIIIPLFLVISFFHLFDKGMNIAAVTIINRGKKNDS